MSKIMSNCLLLNYLYAYTVVERLQKLTKDSSHLEPLYIKALFFSESQEASHGASQISLDYLPFLINGVSKRDLFGNSNIVTVCLDTEQVKHYVPRSFSFPFNWWYPFCATRIKTQLVLTDFITQFSLISQGSALNILIVPKK